MDGVLETAQRLAGQMQSDEEANKAAQAETLRLAMVANEPFLEEGREAIKILKQKQKEHGPLLSAVNNISYEKMLEAGAWKSASYFVRARDQLREKLEDKRIADIQNAIAELADDPMKPGAKEIRHFLHCSSGSGDGIEQVVNQLKMTLANFEANLERGGSKVVSWAAAPVTESPPAKPRVLVDYNIFSTAGGEKS